MNIEALRRASGGCRRSDAQPMGVYFDRPTEPDAVNKRPCALTLACPALLALPAEVAESRGLKGNARETGRLPGLAGRRAVTVCRQIEGLLCCPALTSARPRSVVRATLQANGRVNRAGPAREPSFSLHARAFILVYIYMSICLAKCTLEEALDANVFSRPT